jgi:hypothetical protein
MGAGYFTPNRFEPRALMLRSDLVVSLMRFVSPVHNPIRRDES